LTEERDDLFAPAGVAAARAAEGFAECPRQHVDAVHHAMQFRRPAAFGADESDGMRIVFVSKGAPAVRRLDQAKLTTLAGSEGASYLFFSPNGRWAGFFAGRKLHKVPLEGGEVVSLCSAPGVCDTKVSRRN
jgi:hypothetical protein